MATQTPPDQYALAQAAIGAAAVEQVRKAFALLDPENVDGTVRLFRLAVEAIVQRFGKASVAAAWTHYRQERVAAGVTTAPPKPPTPEPIPADVVDTVVNEAVTEALAVDEAEALDTLDAEVEQLVLDHGRQAAMSAVARDDAARGWARIPEPDACSFCAMLATRGAVYRTRGTANFSPHLHCRCHVQPVFSRYEPSAQVREWQALYKRLKREYKGRDLQVAFRQALEGRPVTGATVKAYSRKGAGVKREFEEPMSLEDHGAAWLDHQIALTESLKPSDWRDAQLKRLRAARAAK